MLPSSSKAASTKPYDSDFEPESKHKPRPKSQTETQAVKRRIAKLDESCKKLKLILPDAMDHMTAKHKMSCVGELKHVINQLIEAHNILDGLDHRSRSWNNGKTLKLTGFNHGLHPTEADVKGFLGKFGIAVESAMIIYDTNFGKDYVIIGFKTPDDAEKALALRNPYMEASAPGGIARFYGNISKLE